MTRRLRLRVLEHQGFRKAAEVILRVFLAVLIFVALWMSSPIGTAGQIQPEKHPPDNTTLPTPVHPVGFSALAQELAIQLVKSGHKRVIVIDFCGPDQEWSPFSAWLADQLSLALMDSAYLLKIVDRHAFEDIFEANHRYLDGQYEAYSEKVRVAKSFGADTIIDATYGPAENGIGVTLDVEEAVYFGEALAETILPVSPIVGKIPIAQEIGTKVYLPLDALWPVNKALTPG
jgi:hypothetical protein